MTTLDLDGDGRLGGPRDAQGYGEFAGSNGLAILSNVDMDEDRFVDLSGMLWKDLPDAQMPEMSPEALEQQRLSTTAHWIVPITLPDGRSFDLLTFHATPPVFDGPEDRNGLRNADELRLWSAVLDGRLPDVAPPEGPFILLGDANLDPEAGDGRRAVMQSFLERRDIHDPRPTSDGGAMAQAPLGTADWRLIDLEVMRVDYLLPSHHWHVRASGVHWPLDTDDAINASRHRLVWADLEVPLKP